MALTKVASTMLETVTVPVTITVSIDGGGVAIATGIVTGADITIPYNMTITQWILTADQTGSLVVDVWRDSYANFPPTVADTITSTDKPTLASASKNRNTNITAWNTSVTAGDILRFKVDSVTTCTYATLTIIGTR